MPNDTLTAPPPGFTPVATNAAPPPGFSPVEDKGDLTDPNNPNNPNFVPPPARLGVGIVKEAGKTLGGATSLIGEALNKIPYVGETLAPSAGLEAEKKWLAEKTQLATPGEKVGAVIEQGAEWMGCDAALKALGKLGAVAKNAPELLEIAEKYPVLTKLFLGGGKGAVIGGTQAGVKAEAEGKDVGKAVAGGAAGGAAGGVIGEAVPLAVESKMARSWINRSVGAAARDVTYGNPAKGILDEDIKAITTGDIEQYKTALRSGKSMEEAAQVAGGRIAAVNGRINELKPQLDDLLEKSTAKISFKDVVDQTIYDARKDVLNNPAMTQVEKDTADKQLQGLYDAIREQYSKTNLTPEQANSLANAIGDRVSWGGTAAVGDEVKPLYRKLYGTIKQAVHEAVPEAGPLDVRMTNLMAAWKDVMPLARKEEVGAGTGVTAGFVWDVLRRFEAEVGRVIPAVRAAARPAAVKAAVGLAGEKAGTSLSEGGGLPPLSDGFVRFRSSVGGIHDVPQESLDQAKGIDPGLQVIQ